MTENILPPRPAVSGLVAYDPGNYDVTVNLSANENPYDLPELIKAKLASVVKELELNRYPDPLALNLRQTIADRHGLGLENVAVGNGGDELIQALLLAYGGAGRTVVTFEPTFVIYKILAELTGTNYESFDRRRDFELPRKAAALVSSADADIVFVCSPNNPTGNLAAEEELLPLLAKADRLVVVDEAYQEFSGCSFSGLLEQHPNLIILRTFSKAFSLAGLRIGYLLCHPEVTANILKVKLPYNVNAFSQAAAVLLMQNQEALDYAIQSILVERDRLIMMLGTSKGFTTYPSDANFFLIKTQRSAESLWRHLLEEGVLVRLFKDTPTLKNCLRVTVGRPEENDAFVKALNSF